MAYNLKDHIQKAVDQARMNEEFVREAGQVLSPDLFEKMMFEAGMNLVQCPRCGSSLVSRHKCCLYNCPKRVLQLQAGR